MVQDQQHYYYAMGKRKTSVAQVRLYTDTGINQVNGRPLEEVFPWDSWQQLIRQPFDVTNAHGQFRIVAKIRGGGVVSQAGALRHGIARGAPGSRPRSAEAAQEGRPSHTRRPRKGTQEVRSRPRRARPSSGQSGRLQSSEPASASEVRMGIQDRRGHEIYLTEERWQHLCDEHPEMLDHERELFEVIRLGRRSQDSVRPHVYLY